MSKPTESQIKAQSALYSLLRSANERGDDYQRDNETLNSAIAEARAENDDLRYQIETKDRVLEATRARLLELEEISRVNSAGSKSIATVTELADALINQLYKRLSR